MRKAQPYYSTKFMIINENTYSLIKKNQRVFKLEICVREKKKIKIKQKMKKITKKITKYFRN